MTQITNIKSKLFACSLWLLYVIVKLGLLIGIGFWLIVYWAQPSTRFWLCFDFVAVGWVIATLYTFPKIVVEDNGSITVGDFKPGEVTKEKDNSDEVSK